MKRLSLAQEKLIRQLHSRQGRKKHRYLLVEGMRSIRTMLAAGVHPDLIVVSPQDLTQPGRRFVEELANGDAPVAECEVRRFHRLSESIETQGLMAIAPESQLPDATLKWAEARLSVYLDGVSDPGNVGAILRTAAACGASIVCLSSSCADILNPKVIRAAAGAIFIQPVQRFRKMETFLSQLQSNNIALIGSDAHSGDRIEDIVVQDRKVCVVFGSEADGLTSEVREQCAELFQIGSAPEVESFNVAAAAAIVLYDFSRRMKLI